ncbi:MAG TPA: hypothetical protein VGR22_12080 [Thermomicrobiales bacterium]|nr:hypothetical protein [Thermomicrobiales bacterium]
MAVSGDVSEPEGGRLTIAYRHPALGGGDVEVEIMPSGSVQTMDVTNAESLREAPQYRARILAQNPTGCLDLMRNAPS